MFSASQHLGAWKMKRREFIAGLGTAAAFSRAAHGQQSMAVIGLLGSSALDDYQPMIAAFRQGLSEAGYLEGKNVSFDHAWANDQYDRLPRARIRISGTSG
jgi:putative ABC transport system substrate-binding protein